MIKNKSQTKALRSPNNQVTLARTRTSLIPSQPSLTSRATRKESHGVLTGMQKVKLPSPPPLPPPSSFPLVFGLELSADLVKLHLRFPQLLTGSQLEKEHKVLPNHSPGRQRFHLPSKKPLQEHESRVWPRAECLLVQETCFRRLCGCGLLARSRYIPCV